MKTTMCGSIFVLFAVCGMLFPAGNAEAEINMAEREQVQTIVWVVEFLSFVTVMAIIWFVWRISKRDIENKKSKQKNS
jgi:heme/copper-type cytochrome/quinol oxidase subunit 2